jgi:hypothetical protein
MTSYVVNWVVLGPIYKILAFPLEVFTMFLTEALQDVILKVLKGSLKYEKTEVLNNLKT